VIIVSSDAAVHAKGTFSLQDAIGSMKSKAGFQKVGVIAVFTGIVRGENNNRTKVEKLMLEAYEEKANEVLRKICDDLKKKRPGIVEVQIHHLLGEFSVGEDLVYVLVAGSHREDVFPVLEEAVERYKKEAPIFKKEYGIDEKGKTTARWATEDEAQRHR
jgi:molybdopterin synthase catalytic subunit